MNSSVYNSNAPCKKGHSPFRYVRDNRCVECRRITRQKTDSRNIAKVYRNSRNKKYYANNKTKINNKIKNKKQKDPFFRLSKNISSSINRALKNGVKFKKNVSWKQTVSFTLEELKFHLEKQFTNGITWDNYGSYWHIDHIKPLSWCTSIEEAWSINNLQPLKASLNCSKNNRFIG